MKNIFKFLLALTLIVSTVSCRENRQPYHNVVYNAQGEQMVRVQDYDQYGNLIDYYIPYLMFNQLYARGGYGAVNTYYYGHRSYFDQNYNNYDRAYSYDSNPRQVAAPVTQYRTSSPNTSTSSYTKKSEPSTTYRTSSPVTYRTSSPSTSTYRSSSPSTSSYRTSSPSSSSSSYRSSSPSSSYKNSSSSSSYRSSSPSSSYSSSYRSSSPSSSYRSSSSSFSSSRSSSSSSSYRSSSPRH